MNQHSIFMVSFTKRQLNHAKKKLSDYENKSEGKYQNSVHFYNKASGHVL